MLFFAVIFLVIFFILRYLTFSKRYENFQNVEQIASITNINEMYDEFYTDLYSKMISNYKENLLKYELENLQTQKEFNDENTHVLDLGCGPGDHMLNVYKNGYDVTCVDQSSNMLNYILKEKDIVDKEKDSKKMDNKLRLIQGDFQNSKLLPKNTYSHCVMYYFSFYFSSNKEELIKNVKNWLLPKGIFAVHLVEPTKFDPILDAGNPFLAYSINKYLPKHKKNQTVVHFDDFIYKSKFDYDKKQEEASFSEEFINKKTNKTTRKHSLKLNLPPLEKTANMIIESGLKYLDAIPLHSIGYEYQYIFYFVKEI